MDPNSEKKKKKTFPNEFFAQIHTTDKVVQNNQNRVKNSKIGFTITKCRNAKNRISNSQHKISH